MPIRSRTTRHNLRLALLLAGAALAGCGGRDPGRSAPEEVDTMPAETDSPYNRLSREEELVILHQKTEPAFVGEYTELMDPGTYVCRRCNAPLYRSDQKFESNCGWPAFDDEIPGAVRRSPDPDGRRVEIVCQNCGGHLGHVFEGEGLTPKNTRHCVNSLSMKFYPEGAELPAVIKKK